MSVRSHLSLYAFSCVAGLLAACAPKATTRVDAPPLATAPSTNAAELEETRSPAGSGGLPRLQVTRVDGVAIQHLETILAPARARLQHCLPGSGGVVDIEVSRIAGELRVMIAPGTTLDPTRRACAVRVLTTVYSQETASNAGGPAVPPSSFTSTVTIRW